MGNIQAINKLIGAQAETNSFGYDGLNRLTSASNPAVTGLAASETYDYDATGNRLGLTYDAWNRINTALGKAYTYDADGNPNSIGGTTLSHDNDGRMTHYGSNDYVYDPEWRRIKKTTANGTRYYVWDGGRLIAEYDQTGTRVARYGYLPNDFSPTEVEINNVVYQVRTDHLGTPLELVNAANTVVWRAHYESFGNAVINDDVDGDGTHVEFNVRMPGQYFDVETGLSYNLHRYYDPATGRYVSSDPIGLAGGLNTFAYVENNPLRFVDPLGLAIECKPVVKLPGVEVQACTENGKEPSEQDAKDAKRMSGKELDKACKNNGYKDAHDLKRDFDLGSDKDIFADKNGNMYAGPRQGPGTPEYLHINTQGITPKP